MRDNIKFGAKDTDLLTDSQIMKMAENLNLDEFINGLEAKLDTPVGENGMQLSGGQQQRIAIIRSLFKSASIRLLDEITSALDSITADKVLEGISKLTKGQTRLIISHKLAETQNADKILVLAEGRVIAEGTHSTLLTSCPLYKELWDKQNQSQQRDDKATSELENHSSSSRSTLKPR